METIRVFTAFSGYDSQCMALQRVAERHPEFHFELVGWSEIEENAIAAHNAVFPQWKDRNYGDICKIDWNEVPDFDLFTYSSPCQDFSLAGVQRGGTKDLELVRLSCGNAAELSKRSVQSFSSWRMSRILSVRNSYRHSEAGSKFYIRSDMIIVGKYSTRRITEFRRIERESFLSRSMSGSVSSFLGSKSSKSVSGMFLSRALTRDII